MPSSRCCALPSGALQTDSDARHLHDQPRLARLTGDEQKAVKITAFDLELSLTSAEGGAPQLPDHAPLMGTFGFNATNAAGPLFRRSLHRSRPAAHLRRRYSRRLGQRSDC